MVAPIYGRVCLATLLVAAAVWVLRQKRGSVSRSLFFWLPISVVSAAPHVMTIRNSHWFGKQKIQRNTLE